MNDEIDMRQVEDSLRGEYTANLSERAKRYLQVKPHGIVPLTHFAHVSAECTLLFRDGHYYGCIALAQAVAEALIRFMCERNSFRPSSNFEKNVQKLATRNFLTEDLKESFMRLWNGRDDYHHLNANIETDRVSLQALALEKAHLLTDIESKMFAFTIVDGALSPSNPKYWDTLGKRTPVFLKLSP